MAPLRLTAASIAVVAAVVTAHALAAHARAQPATVGDGMLIWRYGLEDGLPSEGVRAVAQTTDHYVWVCCEGTVFRFNGHSFVSLADITTVGAAPGQVDALHADEDGNLWAGSVGAIFRYRDGTCEEVALPSEAAQERIRSIANAGDGTLRILTSASVYTYDGTSLVRYGDRLVLPYTVFHCALERPDGSLWLGTNGGLLVVGGGTVVAHTPSTGLPAKTIVQMLDCADGTVWLGTEKGIVVVDEHAAEVTKPAIPVLAHHIRVLMRDRSGTVWVGTHGRGLHHVGGPPTALTSEATYLEDAIITDLLEDVEGNLWVGTLGNGLYHLRAAAVSQMTADQGLPSSLTSSVLEDGDGTLWVGTLGGLAAVRGGAVTVFGIGDGLSTEFITGVYRDSRGVLWVGTQDRWAFRLPGRTFEPARVGFEVPDACVVGVCETADGAVWIACRKNVVRLEEGERGAPWQSRTLPRWEEVTAVAPTGRSDIWLGTSARLTRMGRWGTERIPLAGEDQETGVSALCRDDDGGLWVGTENGSLHYVVGGQATRFDPAGETPGTTIYDILVDSLGHMWLRTDAGICRASVEEMHDVIRGSRRSVRWTVIGAADGLPTPGLVKPAFSTGCSVAGNRMAFATLRGLAFVAATPGLAEQLDPPVVIERVLADDIVAPAGHAVFRPGSRKFVFAFAALSYRDPESTLYRYRLLGLQDGWVDAGTSRSATFLRVPPGSYTFEVSAAAVSGLWGETVASLPFTVRPRVYETGWFQAAAVLVAVGVVLLLHRGRIYRVEQRRADLERLVMERTEQLEAANERLEELTVTDALTGIANHRRFKDMVDLEWRRSARSGSPVALLMIDIDWFKLYNDTYGHGAGDECLRNVARTLDGLVSRPGDLVARYGGEEFVAVLAATDRDGAAAMAERMRLAVEALRISHVSSPTADHLTISLGVAATVPRLGGRWEDLLAASDQALYQAKQGGRNRVVG
jgi:diguanylate cyclase (GGDEF)-like protein